MDLLLPTEYLALSSFKLKEILTETLSPDLLVSFIYWHDLLTLGPDEF